MLVLRLQRTGRNRERTFRIVLSEKTSPVKSGELEILGHYLPTRTPAVFDVKTERVDHWVKKGAIPSDTLARLLKREGVKDMEKFIRKYTKRRPKKEPPAPAPAAPAAEPAAAPADDSAEKAA